MPYISNSLEKNGFVVNEDIWTMKHNSAEKAF